MLPDRLSRFVRLGGLLVLAGLLLWLFLALLLDWALPFLAGFALAALLEPSVRLLTDRLRLPRWAAAGLCTLLLFLTLTGGLALLLWRLWLALAPLLQELPELLAPFAAAGERLSLWTRRLLVGAPPELRPTIQKVLDTLSQQAAALPGRLSAAAAGQAAALLSVLPQWGLGLFTTTLATCFTSAGRPALMAFLRRLIPPERQTDVCAGLARLRAAATGWLRAQGLLALFTFSLLALGLALLGVPSPLFSAAVAALTDALPILGAGLVLLPWAGLSLLSGDLPLGLGLLGLWALAVSARSLLEPRLVGRQAGLPPLAALLAMYLGFRALGVAGMVLAPLGLTLGKALYDAGLLRPRHT